MNAHRSLYMSKQTTQENFIEKTHAFKTIEAYKAAAKEAGLVLEDKDFPERQLTQLNRLRKLNAEGNGKMQIVVTHMARQLIDSVDEDGKPTTKEYLTYQGEVRITNYRGVPYSHAFEVGKFFKPNVVANPGQKYDRETGQALLPEKILVGQKLVYDTELEITDKNLKKVVDELIKETNSYPESIKYYYKDMDAGVRDASFSYNDFATLSNKQLHDLSKRGGGEKGTGVWRDKDGKMRDRDGNPIT